MQAIKTISVLSFLCLSQPSFADSYVPVGNNQYYALNGGANYSMPPVKRDSELGVGAGIDTGFSPCDSFNPAVSVNGTMNNMKDSVMGMQKNIINSATSAIGSLPLYELQKSDPKLYNLVQNGIFSAEQKFGLKTKDCNQAMSEISHGQSPYNDWFQFSKSGIWSDQAKAAAQGGNVDINAASDQVVQTDAKNGVYWIHKGQKSGGSVGNQQPIHAISDVTLAGYNVIADSSRPLDDLSSPSFGSNDATGLSRYWKSPKDAQTFSNLVLGDITVSTKDTQDKTVAGMGLLPIATNCPKGTSDLTCISKVRDKLSALVQENGTPTNKELLAISASNYAVTPTVIDQLRSLKGNSQLQAYYVNRISQAIAMQNLIDEALMLKRVLRAGSQTQAVHNYKPATEASNQAIGRLNDSMKDLLFEQQARQNLSSNVMLSLNNVVQSRDSTVGQFQNQLTPRTPNVQNGAVYTDSSSGQ